MSVVLARQHAPGQWRPRGHSYIQRLGHRDQLPLDGSFDQAVFNLQAYEGRPSAQLGKCIRLGDPPRRGIRNSDVERLALANQIIQPSHDFFDRRNLVPHVDPIEIDVIGLQPLQARFYRLHHILALVTSRVRICARSRHGVFRGQDHALAMVLHKLAEKRFARPVGVKVRGVDEIAPGLAESIVYLPRFVLGRTPTPVIAEGHGAERCL